MIAEALEAAKRSVASKSGKLKDAENRPSETNLQTSNGKIMPLLDGPCVRFEEFDSLH